MITEEQYQEAKRIFKEYKIQKNKSFINNMTCVCCRKNEVKPLAGTGLADGYVNFTEQEKGCWDDGTVEKVSFGYGSKHDMRTFYIAICDDCLSDLEANNLVIDLSELKKQEKNYKICEHNWILDTGHSGRIEGNTRCDKCGIFNPDNY